MGMSPYVISRHDSSTNSKRNRQHQRSQQKSRNCPKHFAFWKRLVGFGPPTGLVFCPHPQSTGRLIPSSEIRL
jgi:hypothetical protein